MTTPHTDHRADGLVARILARSGTALQDGETEGEHEGDEFHLEERAALRRVRGLSTELHDVHEVENRQLRLERVILAGILTSGTPEAAARSMTDLSALALTARLTALVGDSHNIHDTV